MEIGDLYGHFGFSAADVSAPQHTIWSPKRFYVIDGY